jgi:hypothetical protein
MALRHCDGYDPNLTRTLPSGQYLPTTMALSPWNANAPVGKVTVCCYCGLVFDDDERRVTYPHEIIKPAIILTAPTE